MKTLKNICILLSALAVCLNATSCTEDIVGTEEPQGNYVTVGLNCVGELLEITNSPLTRAEEGYTCYYITVYNLEPHEIMTPDGTTETNYMESPYAYGYFYDSLEGVNIKLMEGEDYRFKVAVIKYEYATPGTGSKVTEFTYSSSSNSDPAYNIPTNSEAYYGELDRYIAVEGGNVSIDTKRVSYGAKIIAENLTEGTLEVKLGGQWASYTYITLTPDNPISDKIYSFNSPHSAWYAACRGESYTQNSQIEVNWTKANGEVMPIGTYNVTFERNVRTTIRIKAEELTASKGITVTIEDSGYTDAENEYYIQGGQLVETPINGGN